VAFSANATDPMEVVQVYGKVPAAAARDRAADLLGKVGLPDPYGALARYPSELSGGMRPRADLRAEPAHRRRVDHGARRDDPGPDP
jgi:ABC-type dipeptide/oligopeptide/nickel transport system ATPase component